MANEQTIKSTTQTFLDIYDITNNLVVLKDGTTSLIIAVDAMNFGLLAEEEQDSIMYAYAGLLNSLNYPIQIIIKSQTKDVTGYLNLLKEQEDNTFDRVQQKRIMKYREFVSNLIRERNVLDKKFYVVIPAKPLELGLMPISSVVPGQSQTDIASVDKTMVLEKARNILEPKRDHLIAQFARIGLYSRQLETQEIIQLFYQSYNPEAFEGQTMDNSKSYTAPLVSASIEDFSMDNQSQNPGQPAQPTTAQPAVNPVSTPTAEPATNAASVPAAAPTQPVNTPVMTDVNQVPTPAATEPVSPQGYVPTQMETEQPAQPTTAQPAVNPVPTPNMETAPVADPIPAATPTQPDSVGTTPLPPSPELPKTNPGQVDTSVPQETEIKIDHPGQTEANPSVTPTEPAPVVQTIPTPAVEQTTVVNPVPEVPKVEEVAQTTEKPAETMPPLPEIN